MGAPEIADYFGDAHFDSVEDLRDQAVEFGLFYCGYKGVLYFLSDTDGWSFRRVDVPTYPFGYTQESPEFSSFDEMLDFPIFEGRSMRDAFYDIDFYQE